MSHRDVLSRYQSCDSHFISKQARQTMGVIVSHFQKHKNIGKTLGLLIQKSFKVD